MKNDITALGMISFVNGARQAFAALLDLRERRSEIDVDSLFDAIASVKEHLDSLVPAEIRELDSSAPAFEIKIRKETLQ